MSSVRVDESSLNTWRRKNTSTLEQLERAHVKKRTRKLKKSEIEILVTLTLSCKFFNILLSRRLQSLMPSDEYAALCERTERDQRSLQVRFVLCCF